MITNKNLVYIKEDNEGFTTERDTSYKPHQPYRCIANGDGYLVYGEYFTENEFNKLFDYAYDRIMRDFETIGLVSDGKPISRTAFKKRAYDVKYGRKDGFFVAYFYIHPKECMYRFAPALIGGNKAVQMSNLYDDFVSLVRGDMDGVDSEDIEFGNGGIPLGVFRPLKKRFLYTEKSIL